MLVCAVTILIFILFASVTFAMMKYVDLTRVLAHGHAPPPPRPAGNNFVHSTYASSSSASSSAISQRSEKTARNDTELTTTDDCSLSAGDTSGRRARVIALGEPANSSRLSVDKG